MPLKNNQSDSFTTGVDEIFRITNHLQGRMSLYLAEAGVLEERAHRTASADEKRKLHDELSSLDVLLHQLNDLIETWDALENVEMKKALSAQLSQLIRRYVGKVKTYQADQPHKPKKYAAAKAGPAKETSIEYLMRRIKEGR